MTPAEITATADALLLTAASAIPPERVPTRQFVSHGAPAWEACPGRQLTVHVPLVTHRQSSNPKAGQSQVHRLYQFHVQWVHCVPGLQESMVADATLLHASALELMGDAAAIEDAIHDAAEVLFGSCTTVTYDQHLPLGPSGDVAGWDIGLTWAPPR